MNLHRSEQILLQLQEAPLLVSEVAEKARCEITEARNSLARLQSRCLVRAVPEGRMKRYRLTPLGVDECEAVRKRVTQGEVTRTRLLEARA